MTTGIYFCNCGTNVSDVIDAEVVKHNVLESAGEAYFKTIGFSCAGEGLSEIEEHLRIEQPDRVIIAACSPREHEQTFMQVLAKAGMNPYLLQMVNIREQVAWVTPEKQAATAKATQLIKAALARVAWQKPLEIKAVDICPDVLIIGAGPAGLKAALSVAQSGRKAVLVERSPSIGGMPVKYEEVFPSMECGPCMLEPVLADVLHGEHAPNIELLNLAEVVQVTGARGNFNIRIKKSPRYVDAARCVGCGECMPPCPVSTPNLANSGLNARKAIDFTFIAALPNVPFVDAAACLHLQGDDCNLCVAACPMGEGTITLDAAEEILERQAGALIVAVGSDVFDCAKLENLGYGTTPNVFNSIEFERLMAANGPTGGTLTTTAGQAPESLAIVHCVGSLDERHQPYCSGVCCKTAFKFHHMLQKKFPLTRIYHLYKELSIAGKDDSRLYEHARSNPNAEFIRYANIQELSLRGVPQSEQLSISIRSAGANGDTRTIPVDMAVLCPAVVPNPGNAKLSAILDTATDEYGFFKELHGRMDPARSSLKGIYLAGTCQAPMDIQSATTQGVAAAGYLLADLVPGRQISLEPISTYVLEERCAGCKICITACPYKAITHDAVKGIATVNGLLCLGCGTCAAACPAGAMQANHFTDAAVVAEIEGLLA